MYFEKMLKGETSNIWIMNIVLGAFGTVLGCSALAWNDFALGMDCVFVLRTGWAGVCVCAEHIHAYIYIYVLICCDFVCN